jgi:hypothetical protein
MAPVLVFLFAFIILRLHLHPLRRPGDGWHFPRPHFFIMLFERLSQRLSRLLFFSSSSPWCRRRNFRYYQCCWWWSQLVLVGPPRYCSSFLCCGHDAWHTWWTREQRVHRTSLFFAQPLELPFCPLLCKWQRLFFLPITSWLLEFFAANFRIIFWSFFILILKYWKI